MPSYKIDKTKDKNKLELVIDFKMKGELLHQLKILEKFHNGLDRLKLKFSDDNISKVEEILKIVYKNSSYFLLILVMWLSQYYQNSMLTISMKNLNQNLDIHQ